MNEPNEDEPNAMAQAMNSVSRIMTMAFSIVVPTFIGYLLDSYWGITPLLAIGGAMFGMVAAGWQFYKMFLKLRERD